MLDLQPAPCIADSASLRSIDVTTQSSAGLSIDTIDRALESVGRQRSRFGAIQNRLESTVNNLSNVAVNVAEGRVAFKMLILRKRRPNYYVDKFLSRQTSPCKAKPTIYPSRLQRGYSAGQANSGLKFELKTSSTSVAPTTLARYTAGNLGLS